MAPTRFPIQVILKIMKTLLTLFLLSFSVTIYALVSFPFTGKVTQHFNDSVSIEI
ncbi:hypothetical protein A9E74_02260 [Methylophaga muralis]|uniref:Uncharacterized protein n=2 Tax=Methylophaga TaxID=40222 RepID=A0A1E3GPK6_9GAMM|nr:hypothetical protein A9E74_02260 [Methylophaga muralis]